MENGKENLRKLRGMIHEVYYPIMSFREREKEHRKQWRGNHHTFQGNFLILKAISFQIKSLTKYTRQWIKLDPQQFTSF